MKHLFLFLWIHAITFGVGRGVNKRFFLIQSRRSIWIEWVLGYLTLTSALTLLICAGHFSEVNALALLTAFGLLAAGVYRARPLQIQIHKHTLARYSRYILWLLPIAAAAGMGLLASLAPPTKADELRYHLLVTNRILIENKFSIIYGSPESWTYMAYSIYQVWAKLLGSDRFGALTSWAAWMASGWVLFDFVRRDLRQSPTLAFCVLSVVWLSLRRTIDAIAPGDSSLTALLLLLVCVESYRPDLKVSPGTRAWDPAALGILSVAAVLTKATSAVILAPFCLFVLLSRHVTPGQWLRFFLPTIFAAPFLLKSYTLFGNPVFPLLGQFFTNGAISLDTLSDWLSIRNFWAHHPMRIFPFERIPQRILRDGFSPIYYASWIAGFGICFLKSWRHSASLAIASVLNQRFLGGILERFYCGFLDFFSTIAVVIGFRLIRIRAIYRPMIFLILIHAYAMLLPIGAYGSRFIEPVLRPQSNPGFLRQYVASYETITWINTHTPRDSFVLAETLSNAYFKRKVENPYRVFLGVRRSSIQDKWTLAKILKTYAVTHILLTTPEGLQRKDLLFRFCEDPRWCQKIHESAAEPIKAYRARPPVLGRSILYRIIPDYS